MEMLIFAEFSVSVITGKLLGKIGALYFVPFCLGEGTINYRESSKNIASGPIMNLKPWQSTLHKDKLFFFFAKEKRQKSLIG